MIDQVLIALPVLCIALWCAQEWVVRPRLSANVRRGEDESAIALQLTSAWQRMPNTFIRWMLVGWLVIAIVFDGLQFVEALVATVIFCMAVMLVERWYFKPRRRHALAADDIPETLLGIDQSQPEGDEGPTLEDALYKEFWLASVAKEFGPILLLMLILRSFIVEPYHIPSSSMVPTLETGDFVVVNKFAYGLKLPITNTQLIKWGEPLRGDVVVLVPPHDKRTYIKRVVGIPGDEVEYRNKQLFVNGKRLQTQAISTVEADIKAGGKATVIEETSGSKTYTVQNSALKPAQDIQITVKPGHYFLMGDNRDNSGDSRSWGQVPMSRIEGKAQAVWMHYSDSRGLTTRSAGFIR